MTAVAAEEWAISTAASIARLRLVSAIGHQRIKRPTTSSHPGLRIRRDALLLGTSPTLQVPALATTSTGCEHRPDCSQASRDITSEALPDSSPGGYSDLGKSTVTERIPWIAESETS